ncbi:unnamed protein product [Adineta steineri]|uniref:G-protein coupled receptors family 1 profile domain-containing protein n=1 Tax=Adineta steineri TaxID=433720 RepID=A0A818M2B4_9BILA|nr:unnamed protein product [Adineta steineri]
MSSWMNTLLVIQQQIIRYVYSLYLIFGITGCCLNIILFSQRQFRTVSCCTSSSVAMIMNLVFGIGPHMYTLNHADPITTIPAFCKMRIYLIQVVALTYRWSLTAACLDRYALSSTNTRLRKFAKVSFVVLHCDHVDV